MKTSFTVVALATVIVGCVFAKEAEPFGLVGNPAPKGAAEFLVDIQLVREGILGVHICNGALINPEWVVVPAQCLANNRPIGQFWERYRAVIGGTCYDITKVVEHPRADQMQRDFAMVRLAKRVESVRPAKLFSPTANLEGPATVYLREKADGPVNYLNLTVRPRFECSGEPPFNVGDGHFCVGISTGLNRADLLGSPLVVHNRGAEGLVGYLSFASDKPEPAVFTRINYYIDYIKYIIKNNM